MIINLGDLAWTYNALRLGVVSAARSASVAATNSIAALNASPITSNVCPAQNTVQASFNARVSPPIAPPSVPTVAVDWGGTLGVCASVSSNDALAGLAGGWVSVSARYVWQPLISDGVFGGIPLDVVDVEPVLGAT